MDRSSVAKNLNFVELYARYGKKTAQMGCFTQYIVIALIPIQSAHHADLNLAPYVRHLIQHEDQSRHQ